MFGQRLVQRGFKQTRVLLVDSSLIEIINLIIQILFNFKKQILYAYNFMTKFCDSLFYCKIYTN